MVKKNLILGDLKKDLIKRSLGKTPPTVKYTLLKPGYTLLNQEGKTVGIIPTKKLADEWNIMIREAN